MERIKLRSKLSGRIDSDDMHEITYYAQNDSAFRKKLFRLIFDTDDKISYQTLWVCTHMRDSELEDLCRQQDKLIDELMVCLHSGKKRLMLSLLHREAFPSPLRVDFLNFCMEHMMSQQEPPGIRSLCLKMAHKLTRDTPELQHELRTLLEIMEPDLLSPAMRSARKNVLKEMNRSKQKKSRRNDSNLAFTSCFSNIFFEGKTKKD